MNDFDAWCFFITQKNALLPSVFLIKHALFYFLLFKTHFTPKDKINNPPAASDTAEINSCPVRDRAFANSTEYDRDEAVISFDSEAIRINLLKETPPIPDPR